MIKFRVRRSKPGKGYGRELIGIVLSYKNLDKLREGQPIMFPLSDLKMLPNTDVLIYAAESEEAALEDFKAKGLVPADMRVATHKDDTQTFERSERSRTECSSCPVNGLIVVETSGLPATDEEARNYREVFTVRCKICGKERDLHWEGTSAKRT